MQNFFRRVLIANRGEIARRIIRTLRKMGMESCAIYSDSDSNAPYVLEADYKEHIGPSPSSQSYLNIERIIAAAKKMGAEAVHPGYGFLSENPRFAQSLLQAGIRFIGPSVEAIDAMSNKIPAKKLALKAGVRVVPGEIVKIDSTDQLVKLATSIGFPVIIKSAAGGGGKGMRVVYGPQEIEEAFALASSEALKSFSDGTIFVEKYIESPRHIEIQVIADKFGNTVCLGERECSIQRNNQKVIEEAPSPFVSLNPGMREKMYEQAKLLAQEVGYYSAGTVEFIVDQTGNFYFLEMNTRLQVEHPVTELVTGLDLVKEMINIEMGHPLSFTQKDIKLSGWALESRVYAENPAQRFLPSTGKIIYYYEPPSIPGVRIDSGIVEGSEVSMFYDPMLAKVCAHANTRKEAIDNMQKALSYTTVEGVVNNISFLESIYNNADFIKGDISTSFITKHYPQGFVSDKPTTQQIKLGMLATLYLYSIEHIRYQNLEGKELVVSLDRQNHEFTIISCTKEQLVCSYLNNIYHITGNWIHARVLVKITISSDRETQDVAMKVKKKKVNTYLCQFSGLTLEFAVYSLRTAELRYYLADKNEEEGKQNIKSPISGLVVRIHVKPGEVVETNQPLCVIEGMKMENSITSTNGGTIAKVLIKEGQVVQAGETIVELE